MVLVLVLASLCAAQRPGRTPPKPVLNFRGFVRAVDTGDFTLENQDTRIIRFQTSRETSFARQGKPAAALSLLVGMEVQVSAHADDEGRFSALTVNVLADPPQPAPTPPPAEESEEPAVSAPVYREAEQRDEEGKGPPRLRRGKRQQTAPPAAARPGETPAPAAASPAAPEAVVEPPPEDEFLVKARGESEQFTQGLPNYICKQLTTRYLRQSRAEGFRALDVVSADVVYEDGKESYANIQINGKLVKKPVEETGSWSFGEFGTTLKALLSTGSPAEFRFRKEAMINGRVSRMYGFHVAQPRSAWQVRLGGQWVFPEHQGTVWIDKDTGRVLRIEMEALNVPLSFPLDTVEWVVDYDWTRIGENRFLVPIHAENLACWRASARCTKNTLDFRNYRKFTGESIIYATDSKVDYETGNNPKPSTKK
jgi:hypothetical protein